MMERFAFKIDKVLRANLYKICRLCGIDNPEKVPIVPNCGTETDVIDADAEPELAQKIKDLIGFTVLKDDKMPQFVCTLCVDKINDFYEFREMCFSTDQQTRKLLGIKKSLPKKNIGIKLEMKTEPTANDKRGKKRKLEDVDNKKEIKEELDKTNSNTLSTNKKKKRPTDSNTVSLTTKKQIRLSKGPIQQKVTEDEIKPEIKDEPPNLTEAGNLQVDNAQRLKQLCRICLQRFQTKLKLERHKISEHHPNISKFFCTTCNEEVVKSNDIKSHQLWHKLSKTPYTCGLCNESLLTINLFTRHLSNHTQGLMTPILVFDRQCSLCHETFVTNFLFNTHPCALRAKKCGGCNRKMKNDIEYQMHAAHCDKAYLVASKHVGGGNEAIQIKNENDVEAAVENFTHNIGIPLAMMPVVSLTRLSIEPNQKINIDSMNNISTAITTTAAAAPKTKKKRISKKDLKRVDDLLKSTMDTLVSIKHEPEVNVDAELHHVTPQIETQHQQLPPTTVNDDERMDHEDTNNMGGMHFDGDDDFQNRDDDSDVSDNIRPAAAQSHINNDLVIKQEPRDDFQQSEDQNQHANELNTFNIKKEIPENIISESSTVASSSLPSKVPVLKLKITKEHGTLNSSLVNESNEKVEKKKNKKKKRKEAEKAAAAADAVNSLEENDTTEVTNIVKNSTAELHLEPSMPLPGIVHIKQERIDEEEYFEENATNSSQSTNKQQPEATIMTSIPRMQFQIACVSGGVVFDKGVADAHKETQAEEIGEATATQEIEEPDIKPNREELDLLLSVNENNTSVKSSAADNESQIGSIESQENVLISNRKQLRPTAKKNAKKSVATKSTSQRNNKNNNNTRAQTPVEQMPKIVAVSSGFDLLPPPVADIENETENEELMQQVSIKTEPRDDDDDDDYYKQNMDYNELEIEARNKLSPTVEEPLLNTLSSSSAISNDEQAYIDSIDFSNVRIKQEKDLDICESQLTVQNYPPASHVGSFNGTNIRNELEELDFSTGPTAVEDEEEIDGEDEDEEEEDYDEEGCNAENTMPVEEEIREYREIEWPPLIDGAGNETFESQEASSMTHVQFSSIGLQIANVCSQVAENFTKVDSSCRPTTNSTETSQELLTDKETAKMVVKNSNIDKVSEKCLSSIEDNTKPVDESTSNIGKVSEKCLSSIEDESISDTVCGQTVESAENLLKAQPIGNMNEAKLSDAELFTDNVNSSNPATPADESTSDTVCGQTVESAENLLKAQPIGNMNEAKLSDAELFTDNDVNSSNPALVDEEEQQNILNHEKCDSVTTNSTTFNTTTTTNTTSNDDDGEQTLTRSTLPNIETSNVRATQQQHDSLYLEDISSNSCSLFSSIDNENSTNIADVAPSASASSIALLDTTITTTVTQAVHEETENLYNENIDATLNQQRHHNMPTSSHSEMSPTTPPPPPTSLLISQQNALLHDNSNVNEIAENNNNANIERELLDDVSNYASVDENVNETNAENVIESLPTSSSSSSTSPSQTT